MRLSVGLRLARSISAFLRQARIAPTTLSVIFALQFAVASALVVLWRETPISP
jgi:hypothetical protein